MAFTPAQQQAIIGAFTAKTGNQAKCPGCGKDSFTLGQGIVYLQLSDIVQPNPLMGLTMKFGGPSLPSIPVICATCGNTQLYNVFVLGVAQALGIQQAPLIVEEGSK